MKYLLDEKEFLELTERADRAVNTKDLQMLCSLVANHAPAKRDWTSNTDPAGCILTVKGEHYCDDCPVAEICPHPYKNWSK